MFVRVVDCDSDDCSVIEVPVELDGCILMSTIRAHYPNASGLKYCSKDSCVWRAVRVVEDKLFPSEGSWQDVESYNIVYPKDSKRKVEDDGVSDSDSKLRRVDDRSRQLENASNLGSSGNRPRCTDLIVLGISFKSTEDILRDYFEQFGTLELCEIKHDSHGNSKGFGFIRFCDYDAQTRVLKQREHEIDGRSCQVKIPESKFAGSGGIRAGTARKVFVARLPQSTTADDLRQYFSRFGPVSDVYMSQPFRSFAFVTFRDAESIPVLFTQNHTINGTTIHIGAAEPKGSSDARKQAVMDWSQTAPRFDTPANYRSLLMSLDASRFPNGSRFFREYDGNRVSIRDNCMFYDRYDEGYQGARGYARGPPMYDEVGFNNLADDGQFYGSRSPFKCSRSAGFSNDRHFTRQRPGFANYFENVRGDAGLSRRPSMSPQVPSQGYSAGNANIDLSSIASMLTPAMMATFLNMAAVAANSSGGNVTDYQGSQRSEWTTEQPSALQTEQGEKKRPDDATKDPGYQ